LFVQIPSLPFEERETFSRGFCGLGFVLCQFFFILEMFRVSGFGGVTAFLVVLGQRKRSCCDVTASPRESPFSY